MTCIVGVQHAGAVWIGGDSIATDEMGGQNSMRDAKVFRNGPLVIGACGSLRMTQLLKFALQVPPRGKAKSDEAWLVVDFVNAVRSAFRDGGWERRKPEGESIGGFFLVGYRGKLYTVEDDFNIQHPRQNCDAIGCGGRYARGALFASRGMGAKERVLLALRAACANTVNCRGPFTLLKSEA